MWSVGCIFSEMLSNEALFDSHDDLKHLQRIIDVIGSPSDDDLSSAIRCDKTREYVASLPKTQAQRWCELFPDAQAAGMLVADSGLCLKFCCPISSHASLFRHRGFYYRSRRAGQDASIQSASSHQS